MRYSNDGDADRCLLVDEEGNVLDGDHIMLINALHMKEKKSIERQYGSRNRNE